MQKSQRKSKRLFSPTEAEQVKQDKTSCLKALESPHVEDKAAVRNAYKRLERMEMEHGVPDLTPDQRDQASKRIGQLEEQIKVGMLSHEEMRRNPPGAVDQNVWWEKANKARIKQRRNLLLALNKGIAADQSQELCTIERLRPRTSQLNMANAQIPEARHFSFPSDKYVQNWDAIFGTKSEEEETPAPLMEPEEVEGDILDDEEETAAALQELSRGRR